jgi:hypothetical protein
LRPVGVLAEYYWRKLHENAWSTIEQLDLTSYTVIWLDADIVFLVFCCGGSRA